MNKKQFLDEIRKGISSLGTSEIERYIQYYSEIIDDRMEDGMTEEEAVSALGSPQSVVLQIMSEASEQSKKTPAVWLGVFEKLKSHISVSAVVKVLLAVVLIPIVFVLAVSIISLVFAVFGSALGIGFGSLAAVAKGIILFAEGADINEAFFTLGAGLAMAGGAILLALGGIYAVKGAVQLSKKGIPAAKKLIKREKEETK